MQKIEIKKATVEVKVLKVGNRQVTQAFVKQIRECKGFGFLEKNFGPDRLEDKEVKILGWINYRPDTLNVHRYNQLISYMQKKHQLIRIDDYITNILFVHNGTLFRAYIPISWSYQNNFEQLFISI